MNWINAVLPELKKLLPESDDPLIESHFRPMWHNLNSCVHPSASLRMRQIDESALMLRDSFDADWAKESIQVATEIFDLCWVVTLRRFPKAAIHIDCSKTFGKSPRAKIQVENSISQFDEQQKKR